MSLRGPTQSRMSPSILQYTKTEPLADLYQRGSASPLGGVQFTQMCCGNEAGSYLRLTDSCFTQIKAPGPSRTCNESQNEEEEFRPRGVRDSICTVCGSKVDHVR